MRDAFFFQEYFRRAKVDRCGNTLLQSRIFGPIESRKKDGYDKRSIHQDRLETNTRKICEQNEISLPRQARDKPGTMLTAKRERHFLLQVVILCDGRLGHNRIRRGC